MERHRFTVDDRVRIDIPDETDPDHDRFHGTHGTIVDIIDDNAGTETGDEKDSHLYRVKTEHGDMMDFRWRDLRPPFNKP